MTEPGKWLLFCLIFAQSFDFLSNFIILKLCLRKIISDTYIKIPKIIISYFLFIYSFPWFKWMMWDIDMHEFYHSCIRFWDIVLGH
jgi:hypothetical protein